jgi:hypothetical protein
LVAAQEGNSEAAIDWLKTRTLEADPDGPWTAGARYNLGRVYEAEGRIEEAVECYRADADVPERHGNLLRAHWLKPTESPEPTDSPESTEDAEKPATEPDEPPKSDSPESAEPSEEEANASGPAESSGEAPDEEKQQK